MHVGMVIIIGQDEASCSAIVTEDGTGVFRAAWLLSTHARSNGASGTTHTRIDVSCAWVWHPNPKEHDPEGEQTTTAARILVILALMILFTLTIPQTPNPNPNTNPHAHLYAYPHTHPRFKVQASNYTQIGLMEPMLMQLVLSRLRSESIGDAPHHRTRLLHPTLAPESAAYSILLHV